MNNQDTLHLPTVNTLPEALVQPIVPVYQDATGLGLNTLPEQWTAPLPVMDEAAPITLVDPASSSALPKREAVKPKDGSVPTMTELFTEFGIRGQSNAAPDPNHTALLKHVANLGIPELKALARGDLSIVPGYLLESVSGQAISEATTYAGKLAVTLSEQASQPRPSERATSGIFSQLNRLVQQSAAGREAPPLVIQAPVQVASSPLPTRNPGEVLAREQQVIKDKKVKDEIRRTWGGGVRFGADRYVKPADNLRYNGDPDVANNPTSYIGRHGGDNTETQIIPEQHRPEANTARLPRVSVAIDGSVITRREEKAQERPRFSLRATLAAGVAAVSEFVKVQPSGQHATAGGRHRGSRPSFALNN